MAGMGLCRNMFFISSRLIFKFHTRPRWKTGDRLIFTAVRLEVEENQLVGIFSKIGVVVDALKGA
jgi:hypothetical protein